MDAMTVGVEKTFVQDIVMGVSEYGDPQGVVVSKFLRDQSLDVFHEHAAEIVQGIEAMKCLGGRNTTPPHRLGLDRSLVELPPALAGLL